jgi:hypothetical protein
MRTLICDICGKHPANYLSFCHDRKLDAAGSMYDVFFEIDLCEKCELNVYRSLVKALPDAIDRPVDINKFTINECIVKIIQDILSMREGKERNV